MSLHTLASRGLVPEAVNNESHGIGCVKINFQEPAPSSAKPCAQASGQERCFAAARAKQRSGMK